MANKLYMLYPAGSGFSNDTVDYHGTSYAVAASNNRQAHVLANRDVWVRSADEPQGIVEIYRRDLGAPGDHQLWCGCRIYGGLNLRHLAGVRAIRAAMREHLAEEH